MSMKKISSKIAAIIAATLAISCATVCHSENMEVEKVGFNESDIVLRFGVLSDIHMSGSWNIENSQKLLNNAYASLLNVAGKNADGSTRLDAVLIDGDLTDAMNSSGNVSRSDQKIHQNYVELAGFRDVTLKHFNKSNKTDNVAIIYANGNHDSAGGVALGDDLTADKSGFYSPKLMQKIISGYKWESAIPGKPSATAKEIADYNKEQIYAFDEKNGEYYEFFYGGDEYLGADGLDYGNRIVTVNGFSFITVEPMSYKSEYSAKTLEWLDSTLSGITGEKPDKPVFVATHPRVKNTVFANSSQSTSDIKSVLKKYPQVIIWGGHEHSALNRELAIWQGDFTAVDAGASHYGSASHFGYEDGNVPANAKDLTGYSGKEYRKLSQGHFVEVDSTGNVRISRIDFYNSNPEKGDVRIIGEPWIIPAPKEDLSHLQVYNLENRKASNTAPYFDNDAKLVLEGNDDALSVKVSFPAAKDDTRVISYFLTAKSDRKTLAKRELTSFYYDHADYSELEDHVYNFTVDEIPGNTEITFSVYGIDDFGAKTDTLEAKITLTSDSTIPYPSKEFDISKLNQNSWTSDENKGVFTKDVEFEGRKAVLIEKSPDNLDSSHQMIMNNHSTPMSGIEKTSYLVVDYYYSHNEESSAERAESMRWRFFIHADNYRQIDVTAKIQTNKWATAVIPLQKYMSDFEKDGYNIKQYKFDPFGTTPIGKLDDADKMYISGIRLVHDEPEKFTENGVVYVSDDGYIKGVSAIVYSDFSQAVDALPDDGGTVFLDGDIKIPSYDESKIKVVKIETAQKTEIKLTIGKAEIEANGKAQALDVPAQIIESRTMVPLRAIFEALGASVEWDDATKTVTSVKGDTTVKLTIGQASINVNGEDKALDVPAQIVDSRTLVPVRAIAESFGCDVAWDDATKTVTITK